MTRLASLSTPRVQNGTLYFVALLREELGRRIATARTAAGLSQQDLAFKVGLKHAQDISRYERGKVEVPSHRIDLIAEATGRPRSYFTRDPGEPEPMPQIGVGFAEQLARVENLLGELAILADQRAQDTASSLAGLASAIDELSDRLPAAKPRGRRSTG